MSFRLKIIFVVEHRPTIGILDDPFELRCQKPNTILKSPELCSKLYNRLSETIAYMFIKAFTSQIPDFMSTNSNVRQVVEVYRIKKLVVD